MKYNTEQVIFLKEVLKKLSIGIDPTSDMHFSEDTLLNSKTIQRYLEQSSEILSMVADKFGRSGNTKLPFQLSKEEINNIPLSEQAISVSKFTYAINDITQTQNMRKLKGTQITNWLKNNGFLNEFADEKGKFHKIVTEKGKQIGISTEEKTNSLNETYYLNLYNKEAQIYIKENLNEIAE